MKLYGFSILENALKTNTCFRESVASLVTMTDDTHVFIKKSVDGTEKALQESSHFHLHSMDEQDDSFILQTLREECENIPEGWALYLRPDEVLDVNDLELLQEDIQRAAELHCDAICFRNLNFIENPHTISISPDYPAHSIRLFRLGSNAYFGREDEFDQKIYYSEVKLFNYAYLRKYKEELEETIHSHKDLLSYLGPHPLIMKRRIENWGGIWDRLEVAKVYILGEPRDYCENFLKKIKAKKVLWSGNIVEIPAEDRPKAIIIKPTVFQKLFRASRIPSKMRSAGAHEWTNEFILTLKLSEKGIALN